MVEDKLEKDLESHIQSFELSLKAMGNHRRHLDIGKIGKKIHIELLHSMSHFAIHISNDCG